MNDRNRRIVLAQRPRGLVDDETLRMEEGPVPEPGVAQVLLRNRYLSIDPTIRTWMNDAPGYLPAIALGEVVRSGGIAEVVDSKHERFSVGDLVFGMTGWQEYLLADPDTVPLQVLPPGVPPTEALSVYGVTGMTAYFGLIDVGRVAEGDTVVVSGAAGATGSIAGQIARIKGARVVGIAGTPEKCAWLVDDLGFDAAVNYRTDDVPARLRATCPEGIDLYFDNVGGEILDHCLGRLAMRGRVVLCGAIAAYNDPAGPSGPRNYVSLIVHRGRMEGFLVLDFVDRFPEAQLQMAVWLGEGLIKHAEQVVEGLEHAPQALNMLFNGTNTGKVIVKV